MMPTLVSNTSIRKAYKWWPYLIVVVASVLAYLPTFSGDFIFDDKLLVRDNPYITEFQSLSSYLSQEDGIVIKDDSDDAHTGYYRPLINLFYWIDYKLWGMEAYGFRTTNLILHIICSFVFLRYLLSFENTESLAIWATMLFALHPINTEAVSWITSRNNIIVTIFSLSSLILYIKAHEKPTLFKIILSSILFMLALFSKEYGIMLFPVMWFYRQIIGKNRNEEPRRGVFYWYLPFVIPILLYFMFRINVTESLVSSTDADSFFIRLYFIPYLFLLNVKMLLAPYKLHSFILDYPDSYIDPMALLGVGFILISVFYLLKKRSNSVVVFSLISFLIALFPIMNFISTSAMSLISMRWLYFPMVFLGPLVCLALNRLLRVRKALTITVLTLILVYFGAYSHILNKVLWQNEDSFLMTEVHGFGNSFYAYDLALKHLGREDLETAESYFKIAIDGDHRQNAEAYIEYSGLLVQIGRPAAALAVLQKGRVFLANNTQRGQWYNNQGMALFKLNRIDEAIGSFHKSVCHYPFEPLFWANLGAAYGSVRAYSESVGVLKKGLRLNPDSAEIRFNLAKTYMRVAKYDEAMEVLCEIRPDVVEEDQKIQHLLEKVKSKLSEPSLYYD